MSERSSFAFAVRWNKVDERLLAIAEAKQHGGTLAEAEARDGFGAFRLEDALIHRPSGLPGHFGSKTKLFWQFVYEAFVGGNALVAHPARAVAKSVLVADVYQEPVPGGGTAYLAIRASGGEHAGPPVLAPFPRVPSVLLEDTAEATFRDAACAFRRLVADCVDTANLVWPAAMALTEVRHGLSIHA